MPELPEVETLVKQLTPLLNKATILHAKYFRPDLRYPIPIKEIKSCILNHPITAISRRSKYILVNTSTHSMLIHLGMSGTLRYYTTATKRHLHTHVIFKVKDKNQQCFFLHYVDPRRFGFMCISALATLKEHPRLVHLGVEPLSHTQLGNYLWQKSRTRSTAIKPFIMNAQIVVGVGNIYACESLFQAGIHPESIVNSLSRKQYLKLATAIRYTLKKAIQAGGTTLQDYKHLEGKTGYFSIKLAVYGKEHQPCAKCTKKISHIKQAGRSSWFCHSCQKRSK